MKRRPPRSTRTETHCPCTTHVRDIMAERKRRRRLPLPISGTAEELEVIFIDHPDSRRADRMAETFEPTVDLAGDRAVGVEEAVEDVATPFPFQIGRGSCRGRGCPSE